MNRRYSGDVRDLFKIDLVFHLMKEIPALDSFTFVPMLTEDLKKPGNRGSENTSAKKDLANALAKGRAGSRNPGLLQQMARLQEIRSDTEYFRAIHDLFTNQKIQIRILERPVFSQQYRDDYFNSLFEDFPKKTLLFLDPDIGLEVRNPTKRHLLFEEVKRVHDHLDHESVLMIYQHIPRVIRYGYIRQRCSELHACTGTTPLSITDNEIVFFFLARDPGINAALGKAIGTYISWYPALLMLCAT